MVSCTMYIHLGTRWNLTTFTHRPIDTFTFTNKHIIGNCQVLVTNNMSVTDHRRIGS